MKKVKLKKRKNKLRIRKKLVLTSTLVLLFVIGIGYSLLSVDLNIFGNITVKKHYGRTLYEVLEKEADIGTYAREYTGEHHDSFTEEPSKKIYHWYAAKTSAGNTLANEILDKNNVAFAGYCWKMFRTTDTGGVKLVYNGSVVDGTCLDTNQQRHFGYSDVTESLGANYYYSSEYSYNNSTGKFMLEGNKTQSTFNNSTYNQLIGMYTCKSTDPDEECDQMSYVIGHAYSTVAYLIKIDLNNTYKSIGSIRYYMYDNSLAYVGYMYGDNYPNKQKSIDYYDPIMIGDENVTVKIGSSITDNQDGTFTINDPIEVTKNDWTTDYNNYLYHYYCYSGVTTCTKPYFIVEAGKTTRNYEPVYKMKIATSHNGYTLLNPIETRSDELIKNRNNYTDYLYTCRNTDDVCTPSNYSVIYSITNRNYSYYQDYYFGTGVSWNGTAYELINPVSTDEYVKNDNYVSHHFYCSTLGATSCNKVDFITRKAGTYVYTVSFQDGEEASIQNAMDNMIKKNTNDSLVKHVVDDWYEKNLRIYSRFFEDTIFCNDRQITNLNGWGNNSNPVGIVEFRNYGNLYTNLDCPVITDQLSINNNQAKLKYPVGIMTVNEANILTNKTLMAMVSGWTMTACSFSGSEAKIRHIPSKNVTDNYGMKPSSTLSVYPVISLKPGTEYVDGDGSMADPYVLNDEL